ncbi:MAG: DUF1007 family protein [Spirochaetales bacterium]|nr:DUF1007 family protein [Spirochaetales bacterium]
MRKLTLLFIFLLTLPVAAFSHPHMFIDMTTEAVFSEDGFDGVKIRWLFDMIFTGSVLMDNGIGWTEKFSDEEIEIIRDTSFINLKNYGYYTYFNTGGHFSRPETFSNFRAFMTDNRLGYEFFLPYKGEEKEAGEVRIAVYDDSFFCDIAYTGAKPVSVKSPENILVNWVLSEKKNAPIFYDNTAQKVAREGAEYSGQAFPVELVLSVARK